MIVEAHNLLPPKPLFWVNEDKTIPLWRTTLWTHAETVQWLAETGEPYPPELRDELQPRIDQLKSSQHLKRTQPPPPPQPTRWTERSTAKQHVQPEPTDTPHDPRGPQSTPQQIAERERQYMELQSIIHQANQQTLTDSRPAKTKQTQKPANLLAASQQSTDNAAAAASSDPAADKVPKAPTPPQSKPPDKISAQSLFHIRPGPPSAPPATKHERIPRVPACYPLTLTPQLTTKMMSNSNLRNNKQPRTTHQQRNRRRQIHPKNRQRLRPRTLLVLAALSRPVNPNRTTTSPTLTSQCYRIWRKEPVREWPPMKRNFPMPASTYLASENALKEWEMTDHQTLCNPLLAQT